MTMDMTPVRLAIVEESQLEIEWNDGQVRRYSFSELRKACPCATCKEKKAAEANKPPNPFQILKPHEAVPLKVTGMKPIGNYAYGIAFSDQHDTGIYSLDLLRSLGKALE